MTPPNDASDYVDETFGHPRHAPQPPAASIVRQVARAVTGDQLLGDMIAAALLRRLGDVPNGFDGAALVQRAMTAWRDLADRNDDDRPFSVTATLRAAGEVFDPVVAMGVLVDVLGLSREMAAAALELSDSAAADALRTARDRRAQPIDVPVLVLEDDPMVAEALRADAVQAGARAVMVAHTPAAAIAHAQKTPPAVILADFDLKKDETGLDVARALGVDHQTVPVFVTAHPRDVLTGAEGEPAFVLAKPYRSDTVRAALHYAATAPRLPVITAA